MSLPTFISTKNVLFLIIALSFVNQLSAKEKGSVKYIRGEAATGFNQKLGEALWDFGELGSPTIVTSFGYNPDSNEPDNLTKDTPRNTLIATGADLAFYDAIGVTPDEKYINIPLREFPIIINDKAERATLKSILETSEEYENSLSVPAYPVTLRKWLKVKSLAKVKCRKNGTSTISLYFNGLIPNGIYTVWGIFAIDDDNDGNFDTVVPKALGGVPNALIPNKRGRAEFQRKLNFCPLDAESGLKVVDIAYHIDGNVFGAASDLSTQNFPGLLAAPTHVEFPFNVTKIR